MWMLAVYRLTHTTSCSAWSEGWQPQGAQSAFIKIINSSLSREWSDDARCRSYENAPCTTELCLMIGGCQANVERCKVGLKHPEPGIRGAIPVCRE